MRRTNRPRVARLPSVNRGDEDGMDQRHSHGPFRRRLCSSPCATSCASLTSDFLTGTSACAWASCSGPSSASRSSRSAGGGRRGRGGVHLDRDRSWRLGEPRQVVSDLMDEVSTQLGKRKLADVTGHVKRAAEELDWSRRRPW